MFIINGCVIALLLTTILTAKIYTAHGRVGPFTANSGNGGYAFAYQDGLVSVNGEPARPATSAELARMELDGARMSAGINRFMSQMFQGMFG